jgi:RNA polymerase sigma-70 factor (ECF subfamily)
MAALAQLPARQRDAIRARILEERPYDEIADELQCSELVVRKTVSRGLRALRSTVEQQR